MSEKMESSALLLITHVHCSGMQILYKMLRGDKGTAKTVGIYIGKGQFKNIIRNFQTGKKSITTCFRENLMHILILTV